MTFALTTGTVKQVPVKIQWMAWDSNPDKKFKRLSFSSL